MKIIGTKYEVTTLLSGLQTVEDKSDPIPPLGYIATYRGVSINIEMVPDEHPSPCSLCMYNPPSSSDGKPCSMCPACAVQE